MKRPRDNTLAREPNHCRQLAVMKKAKSCINKWKKLVIRSDTWRIGRWNPEDRKWTFRVRVTCKRETVVDYSFCLAGTIKSSLRCRRTKTWSRTIRSETTRSLSKVKTQLKITKGRQPPITRMLSRTCSSHWSRPTTSSTSLDTIGSLKTSLSMATTHRVEGT